MKIIVFTIFCIGAAVAMPYDIIEDDEGNQYYALPITRSRRQTDWLINQSGAGLSHTGTIYENDHHRFDGTASAARSWDTKGILPNQVGGRLDYTHQPSGSGLFVAADNTRGYGTDVNVGAKYNIYEDKDFKVDLTGQYGKHYGGPDGVRDPGAGIYLKAAKKF